MPPGERLFGWQHAFDDPVAIGIAATAVGLLAVAPLLIRLAGRRADPDTRRDLWLRYRSWLVLAPMMIGPILLGAFWTMSAILLLTLLCGREYARMTGSFRNRTISAIQVTGTLLLYLAVFDHWYGLFMAMWPLTVGAICVAGLLQDQPRGYVQRVALGVLGFMLCSACLAHLAYFANDNRYRPILLLLLVGIQMNDVFAYCTGKLLGPLTGNARLAPNTSPGKTAAGALGAIALTTTLVALLAAPVFRGTALAPPLRLMGLGLIVSILGILGDLMLSAIKRDVGVKDTGRAIPGHGGLLDRFDSTLLVAPAAFHYVGYFVGVGMGSTTRILTG